MDIENIFDKKFKQQNQKKIEQKNLISEVIDVDKLINLPVINIYSQQDHTYKFQGIGLQLIKNMVNDENKFVAKVEDKQFILDKFQKQYIQKKKLSHKQELKSKIQQKAQNQVKLFKIEDKQKTFDMFLPMNKLWKQYIEDLLKNDKNENSIFQKILRSDFHGSMLQILKSKCNTYEGLSGIVLKDNMRSFEIITQDDKMLTILKQNSIFLFQINQTLNVKIYGSHLILRPSERSKIKLKMRQAQKFILESM